MDRHLCLDLKSFGQHRKSFYKTIAESPVACHNIFNITAKQPVNASPHQTVSHIMKRPFIFSKIRGRQPVPHHHIRIMIQHLVHHLCGILHRVSVIPVHHYITLRLHLAEHAPNHISFPLHILIPHQRSRLCGQLRRSVAGVIIIYINHRLRQSGSCILHYFGNRFFLVITRYQHCYLIHYLLSILS